MNKRTKLGIVSISLIFIITITLGVFFAYNIPINSRILVATKLNIDNEIVNNLKNDLNGNYANIYDTEYSTHYVIDVYAPLTEIIKSKRILKNSNILDVCYNWELKKRSSLIHEM